MKKSLVIYLKKNLCDTGTFHMRLGLLFYTDGFVFLPYYIPYFFPYWSFTPPLFPPLHFYLPFKSSHFALDSSFAPCITPLLTLCSFINFQPLGSPISSPFPLYSPSHYLFSAFITLLSPLCCFITFFAPLLSPLFALLIPFALAPFLSHFLFTHPLPFHYLFKSFYPPFAPLFILLSLPF